MPPTAASSTRITKPYYRDGAQRGPTPIITILPHITTRTLFFHAYRRPHMPVTSSTRVPRTSARDGRPTSATAAIAHHDDVYDFVFVAFRHITLYTSWGTPQLLSRVLRNGRAKQLQEACHADVPSKMQAQVHKLDRGVESSLATTAILAITTLGSCFYAICRPFSPSSSVLPDGYPCHAATRNSSANQEILIPP